ncbi:MAG: methylenetetrahydrofolate reductase C-terminal domain-containing protein [Thermodesulfobacteriaceae bacterium]|nr:methylenetetrahydrofolate reductase C-terminal domain-containing protein [Thermodesulfobacteriaceae bacterium]MDW8136404.1 methylenetetrahydrofolate reductase C-terminal domain-containing protein [Thermodesulfobacterium sp.]
MSSKFKEILEKKEFIFTFELVPGRSVRTRQYKDILRFLEESTKYNFFQAFTITDNAGGHPALAPSALGREIKRMGMETIIHFSCKDKNRNQLESDLLALDREGLHNLLVITGDYPFYGYLGKAKPVFDLDSVLLLKMISEMEKGMELSKFAPGGGIELPPIPFFKGCVINPFKLTLAETWIQYIKLYKKLKAGAYFVITQSGFFPKKWLELKKLLDEGLTKILAELFHEPSIYSPEEDEKFRKIPLIGGLLYTNTLIIKSLLNTKIPGILMGKKFLETLERTEDLEDKILELNAKLAAILKGFGYKGVHLTVFPLNYEKLQVFMDYFYKFESRWEEYLPEFDERVVFLEKGQLKEKDLAFISEDLSFFSLKPTKHKRRAIFYLSKIFHFLFFARELPWYPLLVKLSKLFDKSPCLKRWVTTWEYTLKRALYNCRECGDCCLYELNYLCPQSDCAKYILNGACGGSINGYCEVYPFEKRCIYVRAFERAISKKELKKLLFPFDNYYIPPRNWSLYKTSSWLNFHLFRDHHAKYEIPLNNH